MMASIEPKAFACILARGQSFQSNDPHFPGIQRINQRGRQETNQRTLLNLPDHVVSDKFFTE